MTFPTKSGRGVNGAPGCVLARTRPGETYPNTSAGEGGRETLPGTRRSPPAPGRGWVQGVHSRLPLQTAEERFDRRVIPTRPDAAHTAHDPLVGRHPLVVVAGVLAAPIRVRRQPGVRPTTGDRHLHRIHHQSALHRRGHRPAHHLAADNVLDDGQIQPPSRVGTWVISAPTTDSRPTVRSVWRGGREPRAGRDPSPWLGRTDAACGLGSRGRSSVSPPCSPSTRTRGRSTRRSSADCRSAASSRRESGASRRPTPAATTRSGCPLARPGVVSAGRHLQRPAQPGDRPLARVVGEEPERQLGGRAKSAAAFFDRSRSARRRTTSARRRRSSSAGLGPP